MSETIDHIQLVSRIIDLIRMRYSDVEGLCLFCDCPSILQTEKPYPIDGYFPDVLASTTPQTLTIIGEAKTLPDLDTPHSLRQITAFLRFLRHRPNPLFIFSIPWIAKGTAKGIVSRVFNEHSIDTINVEYLIT